MFCKNVAGVLGIKKIRNISIIIVISILCVILNSTSLSCIRVVREDKADSIASNSKTQQVSDRDRLITAFGYPDEFLIVFDAGKDNLRSEVWIYSNLERYYTFENGKYTGGDNLITPKLSPDKFNMKPGDFVYGMNQQSIIDLVGEKGTAVTDEASGYKVVVFDKGQIACTFNNADRLINVQRMRTITGIYE